MTYNIVLNNWGPGALSRLSGTEILGASTLDGILFLISTQRSIALEGEIPIWHQTEMNGSHSSLNYDGGSRPVEYHRKMLQR